MEKEVKNEVMNTGIETTLSADAEGDAGQTGTNSGLSVNAGIKITILKHSFVGIVQKDDAYDLRVLIAPGDEITGQAMDIGEISREIAKLTGSQGDENEVTDQLGKAVENFKDSSSPAGISSINFYLRQAYMLYEKKAGASDKNVEYAFSLTVDMSHMLKSIDLFSIQEISFSIWKTTRKGVLDKMGTYSIDEYLEKMS